MLAHAFKCNFRTVVARSLVAATLMSFGIIGFAIAAGANRAAPEKSSCVAKPDKLLHLVDATAPLFR